MYAPIERCLLIIPNFMIRISLRKIFALQYRLGSCYSSSVLNWHFWEHISPRRAVGYVGPDFSFREAMGCIERAYFEFWIPLLAFYYVRLNARAGNSVLRLIRAGHERVIHFGCKIVDVSENKVTYLTVFFYVSTLKSNTNKLSTRNTGI